MVVLNNCRTCLEFENANKRVTEMIVQQRPLQEILATLSTHAGDQLAERQVAFYLLGNAGWELAMPPHLTADSKTKLEAISPEGLSDAIFCWNSVAGSESGFPFESGCAQHIYSGMGELLGLFISLADGPMQPVGSYDARIRSVCRFAALAVEQKNLVDELAFKADHDALTGLFNRSFLGRMLDITLKELEGRETLASLIYINLDRFRLVNDVTGHAVGDRLLAEVGRRFLSRLEKEDVLSRAGGDEFAILLRNLHSRDQATTTASILLESLAAPFTIDGHELFLSASAGISCSGPGSTAESLQREAYIALYNAKQAGKGRSMFFHPAMASTPPERLQMEKQLRSALRRKEMLLYFQPQVEMDTGAITGAEVLLRWRPENLGLVSPGAFIPILEETGLIIEFGRWVLLESCRQGQEWLSQTGIPVRLGVNVAAVQFLQPDFRRIVEQALTASGFPAEMLELELTESLFVGDFAAAAKVFRELQSTGITFALDDFGTGQSSLSYLQKLPFQRLKIDQSFIRPIQAGEHCPPLVENIIRMAGSMGMTTIAEGIETAHQADLLRKAKCREGQGYFFAKPLPAKEFLELFIKGRSPAVA